MDSDENDAIELSRALADVLGLPERATVADVAARVASLGRVREPRQPKTRRLLALAAVASDELAGELFRGIDDPSLVLLGAIDDLVDDLLQELAPVSERELCEDLGLGCPEEPREALGAHLGSAMDAVAAAVWARGRLN